MVYISRRARREQEEKEEAEAQQQQQQQEQQEVSRRERRRRHDNQEDDDANDRETTNEDEGSDRYRRRMERERYYTQGISANSLAASGSTISTPSPPPRRSSGASPNPGASLNMSTTAAGNKLAKEIHDEFLTCKICLEGFKSPKCLDCLHTFCEQCIDNHVLSECTYKKYSDYREFTCPLCRKRTQLPVGGVKKLPDNFLVSSLGEVVARQKPSKFPFCDICKLINRKHREAVSKCIDCNKLMCKPCVDMHKGTKVTQQHSIFDVEIEKDIECKEHEDEVVRFYCEPCESCICVLCTFNEHKDHEITQFSDAVCKYKENIKGLLSSCKDKIDIYDKQIALLDKCDDVIKAAEQRIHDTTLHFISELRSKEKSLIEDLHTMYGQDLMEFVNRKNEMHNNLDGLKSTCNLTELVLKGKDIELLLLKRQVQEKLMTMANVELKDLPPGVGKRITFVSGSFDLGRLEDADSPVDKEKRKPEGGSNDNLIEHEATNDFTKSSNREHQETSRNKSRESSQQQSQDTQRLTLPNMVFGRTNRNKDYQDEDTVESKPAPPKPVIQRTVNTQTDKELSRPGMRMANRAIQVDLRDGHSAGETFVYSQSFGNSVTPQDFQTKATGTDTVSTLEKACNTKSNELQASQSQTDRANSSTSDRQNSGTTMQQSSESPTTSRQRRRRERNNRQVEVSARPTTGMDSTEGGRYYNE